MELIISSLFLFIIFISFISFKRKAQQVAKEVLKEIINGPEGKCW